MRLLALSLAIFLVACGGATAPAQAELTSSPAASRGATRLMNGTGRPDAEIVPIIDRALENKPAASRFALVVVLEPPTAIGTGVSVSAKLDVRSKKDDSQVVTIRKTVSQPNASPDDRKVVDELLGRAISEAADDAAKL